MKIKSWDDERIAFDDGSYISYDHKQDCCEYNWADFSVLDVMLGSNKDYMEFDSFEVTTVEECGFLLKLNLSDKRVLRCQEHNIFIPCYSEQNGYYSTDIRIIYSDKDNNVLDYWYLYSQLNLS